MHRSILLSSALYAVGYASSAAYFLENNPAGSNIVALQLDNGIPSNPIRTSTGGVGALTVGATADPLGAQGSVTVAGNKLFTVNAGSNTLAYFEIYPWDPYHPHLITTVDTLGEFPMSTTYNEELNKVCVLNGGAKSGVACFDVSWDNKLTADGPLRSIPLNETTPPTGPPGSAGEVGFVGSKIVVSIKGAPNPGYLVVFDGDNKRIYQNPKILLDFGFSALNESAILISTVMDAYIIDIDTFTAQSLGLDAAAACWVALDGETGYVADAGKPTIYTVANDVRGADLTVSKSGGGVFDMIVVDQKITALVVANGIVTYDLTNQQETFLDLSSFGNRTYYTGFAAYDSEQGQGQGFGGPGGQYGGQWGPGGQGGRFRTWKA